MFLADELKLNNNINDALESYERTMKPFVELNQNVIGKDSFSIVAPKNNEELEKRNVILDQMSDKAKEEVGANDVVDITRVIDYPGL